MKQGWVYILTNQGMPGLIKIGYTKHPPHERARELYGTGVAFPFEVAYQARCHQYQVVEQAVHDELDAMRVNDGREFFACSVAQGIEAVRRCAGSRLIGEQNLARGEDYRVVNAHTAFGGSVTQAAGRLKIRHLLLGALVFAALIAAAWWFLGKHNPATHISETQKIAGYTAAQIGKEDINMRTCSSTDCSVIAVLPADKPLLIRPGSQTDKAWVYAEFTGDVCYPQHYVRDEGCTQWAQNNIVEDWVYAPNLADGQLTPTKQGDGSVLDALF
ncbi:GIY-YIG nuclease family protein [Neisseria perflava]|uniref:GIY-YIG nuclease family protein n=1 Tax=Neisseria perflava TaxID=33053 RepID=UPI0020A1A5B2|nr:GIY-YIG nuclease family protein [Neisseria perflava]MCP1660411.1 hypothetical protein [Neisseria perflava]MCP1772093.1 hypothetical protein [Neisseria perflava]